LEMALDKSNVSHSPTEFNRFIAAHSILGTALPDRLYPWRPTPESGFL
jgi:hypothetical protein